MIKRIVIPVLGWFLLCLSAAPALAQMDDKGYRLEKSLEWVFSVPTAGTHSFIQNVSPRGLGFELLKGMGDRTSLGFSFRWVYFTQTNNNTSVTSGATTVTGNQYLAVDSLPLQIQGRYWIIGRGESQTVRSFTPFVGGGVGGMYGERKNEVGLLARNQNGWQFSFNVEAGAKIRTGGPESGVFLGARYDAGVGADAINALSFLSFSLGLFQGF